MTTQNNQKYDPRAEVKELLKTGKAFSMIGDSISKAYESAEGEYFIEAIGSSDQEDLVGDVMTPKALTAMEEQFIGKTVFMNHRTNVPDDVFGAILETKVLKDNGVQKLWFKIVVEKENDAAMKTWRVMSGGRTQLGTSVTVLVKAKKPNPKRSKGFIIDDVEVIELSIVGVPCNRESKTLTASASKALGFALSQKSADDENSAAPETSENPEILTKGENMNLDTAQKSAAEIAAETAAVQTETAEIPVEKSVEKTVETPAGAAGVETVENPTEPEVPAEKAVMTRTSKALETARTIKTAIAAGIKLAPQEIAVKGMFNDILAQKPRLWELYDILCSVRWTLESQKWVLEQSGGTDFSSIISAWGEALDEFKAAAIVSFKFWNKIDVEAEDADDLISNALELEKSFTTLADALAATEDEVKRKSLADIGSGLLEAAEKAGITFAGTPAITTELVEKSAEFIAMKERATQAEATLSETETQLEAAKAGLAVANEALEKFLREPLVTVS